MIPTSTQIANPPTRLIGDAREGRPVPHVGLPAKIVDRGGHGKRVARCGPGPRSLGSAPGRCAKASKKDKGRMLDGVCSVTGWSREGARRRRVAAARRPPGRGRPEPVGRARKYS